MWKGPAAALMAAFLVAGCSSVAELPYPKLSEVVRPEDPTLSKTERAELIEELQAEQKTHKAEAESEIETR